MKSLSKLRIEFPKRLRAARINKRLTQYQLGTKIGVQASVISNLEHRLQLPSFGVLRNLADALDVSADYLLCRKTRIGTGGPIVDRLLRSVGKTTKAEFEDLVEFAEILADKNTDAMRWHRHNGLS